METEFISIAVALVGFLASLLFTRLQINASKENSDNQVAELKQQIKIAEDALSAERKRESKDFCFRLYEHWTSESMRECRTTLWNYLSEYPCDAGFDFASMEKKSPNLWDKAGAVTHFMGDLNIFLDEDVVDKVLATRLFGSTLLLEWLPVVLHPASSWGPLTDFINKEVKPLEQKFSQ